MVPMAVPDSCFLTSPLNSKYLFFKTNSAIFNKFYVGMLLFSLLSKVSLEAFKPVLFGIDTSLNNAVDTDKTKAKFAQREALHICSAYRWFGFLCVLALSSVSLSTVQCYYKSFGSSLKYRIRFNQLIQPHRANYLSIEEIHLLFCSNIF